MKSRDIISIMVSKCQVLLFHVATSVSFLVSLLKSFNAGETINEKDRCPQCNGEKVLPDKKMLEVVVEKGMQNGQRITFQGEADEAVNSSSCCFC